MRLKSVVNTLKQNKEHPHHFYMGDPHHPLAWFRLYDKASGESSENNVQQGFIILHDLGYKWLEGLDLQTQVWTHLSDLFIRD